MNEGKKNLNKRLGIQALGSRSSASCECSAFNILFNLWGIKIIMMGEFEQDNGYKKGHKVMRRH